MSEMQKFVHNKNIRKNIHIQIINRLSEEVKDMKFGNMIDFFCDYKLNYNSDITIRDYKYHLIDMTYPRSLRYNIIDNYLIFEIKKLLNFIFGYDNVTLIYYFTEFEENLIVSFYLMFGDIEDLHFIIVE